jgi:hypothetical protein
VKIEYVATDATRQTISWVKLTRPSGATTEFAVEGVTPVALAAGHRRAMDCLDCHNVVAHRIATSPEEAVDEAIRDGAIPRALPFVRREGVRLLRASYPTQDEALSSIQTGLQQFYKAESAREEGRAVRQAVVGLQRLYQRNVFPSMQVTFGVYPDNLGHTSSPGCFRCHDGSHVARDGTAISSDCETCHRLLDAEP